MMNKIIFGVCITAFTLFTACTSTELFERTTYIPNQEWQSSFKPSFIFNISDSTKLYNIYLFVRHRNLYAFNNLWVQVTIKDNVSTNHDTVKYELSLANNNFGWLGSNIIGDVVEQYVLLTPEPIHLHHGENQITIAQIMRQDPLKYVLNIGVRIEQQL